MTVFYTLRGMFKFSGDLINPLLYDSSVRYLGRTRRYFSEAVSWSRRQTQSSLPHLHWLFYRAGSHNIVGQEKAYNGTLLHMKLLNSELVKPLCGWVANQTREMVVRQP